jgi:hypothetical protein
MNEQLNNLPSIKNMGKLIIFLLLALVAFALVLAIVKMLVPLLIVGLLILGGLYLFRHISAPSRA